MGRWDGHVRKLNRCLAPGCDWVGYKKRVCSKHAKRMRLYGDYETVLPRGKVRGDDRERFWSHVDRDGPIPEHRPELGPCWVWGRAVQKRWGYGLFVVGGRKARESWLAHRYSWTVTFGEIPEGMLVCHHCDRPACVRPDHLFLGTDADNNSDMMRKGRNRHPSGDEHGTRTRPESIVRGMRNGNAKFTDHDVREIRRRYAAGESQQSIADDFGVSQTTVSGIVRGTTWGHVA